jgi:hypothetical protein
VELAPWEVNKYCIAEDTKHLFGIKEEDGGVTFNILEWFNEENIEYLLAYHRTPVDAFATFFGCLALSPSVQVIPHSFNDLLRNRGYLVKEGNRRGTEPLYTVIPPPVIQTGPITFYNLDGTDASWDDIKTRGRFILLAPNEQINPPPKWVYFKEQDCWIFGSCLWSIGERSESGEENVRIPLIRNQDLENLKTLFLFFAEWCRENGTNTLS